MNLPQLGSRTVAILSLIVVAFGAPRLTTAACTVVSMPVLNAVGTVFENCPDNHPVGGFVALLSNPAGVNSYGQDPVCEDSAGRNGLGQACTPEAQTAGDGRVVMEYDWGGWTWYGSLGCPTQGNAEGVAPVIAQVVANDGSSALVRTGFDLAVYGYAVDYAFPYDAGGGTLMNASCRPADQQSVRLDGVVASGSNLDIDLTVLLPVLLSDCGPASGGSITGTCPEGGAGDPVVTRGRLFTRLAACGGLSELRIGSWSLSPVQPDAAGQAHLTVANPSSSDCLYIGTTYAYNGLEVPAIAGFQPVAQSCPGGGCGDLRSQSRIDLPDTSGATWNPEAFQQSYNLYRGDLAVLRQTGVYTQDPASVPLAARSCHVAIDGGQDGVTLAPGQGVFFLVTGNDPAGESSLGTDSNGTVRPNANPCN
jgi:hypothetical protein